MLFFWNYNDTTSDSSLIRIGHLSLFTKRKNLDLRYSASKEHQRPVFLFDREHSIQKLNLLDITSFKYIIVKESKENINAINLHINKIEKSISKLSYKTETQCIFDWGAYLPGKSITNLGYLAGAGSTLLSGVGLALLGLTGPFAAAGALGVSIATATGIITGGEHLHQAATANSKKFEEQHIFHCGSIIAHCLNLNPNIDLQQAFGLNQIPAIVIQNLADTKTIESSQGFPGIKHRPSFILQSARKNILKNRPIEDYQYKPFKKWHALEIPAEEGLEDNKDRALFQEARMFSRFFRSQIEWRRIHPETYELAEEKGWLQIMCAHMDHTIDSKHLTSCINHAKEFSSLEEWEQSSSESFTIASNKKWIHSISQKAFPIIKEEKSQFYLPYIITATSITTVAITGYLYQHYQEEIFL